MKMFVLAKLVDLDAKVTEVYFDVGGLKVVTKEGVKPSSAFSTMDEVHDYAADSMYRFGNFVELTGPDEAKGLIGMSMEAFSRNYEQQLVFT